MKTHRKDLTGERARRIRISRKQSRQNVIGERPRWAGSQNLCPR